MSYLRIGIRCWTSEIANLPFSITSFENILQLTSLNLWVSLLNLYELLEGLSDARLLSHLQDLVRYLRALSHSSHGDQVLFFLQLNQPSSILNLLLKISDAASKMNSNILPGQYSKKIRIYLSWHPAFEISA